ncbi:uncharacterized protein K460DRAFT_395983 [Cucurbitaria berberidis CBS 394.84]|uniref:Zn(2)-C6 fungal-type domain-containing protein n=1 Tax=Cucurbitaria berberidis CBS 394.84 TaxID=1168544 RepID=A0A9P4L927_9PLEO|nr:uncharacterized protein K460DRAFT_395983 [Cucurbitaria berberidis CBS 394.84]KAF1846635.1 hypothetical protein K460DRAFT_395983 [Cucurbitaria berberidis CBS 394.84]
MKSAKRSCGTCRDRRLLCDRAIPVCLRCSRSKRTCKGYGLRLSWPIAGDSRRAVVAKQALLWSGTRSNFHAQVIHMSTWDIQMHYHMTAPSSSGNFQPVLRIPILWNPSTLEVGDADLLQYFQCVAYQSLPTFGQNNMHLGNILMRMALSSNTSSATALLKSLLALSSLHRHGVQSQAITLKIASLGALVAAASKPNLGANEMIQHIATGMLLCSFEAYQSTCTSGQWMCYLTGIKEILNTDCLQVSLYDDDLAALKEWVYYHDVLAHFTVRHWATTAKNLLLVQTSNRKDIGPSVLPNRAHLLPDGRIHLSITQSRPLQADDGASQGRRRCIDLLFCLSLAAPPINATLQLLSEVCDAVSARPDDNMSGQKLEEYKGFLEVLDWRIRNLAASTTDDEISEMTTVTQLFQLAMLVYLNRATENLLDQSVRTQQQIEKGFALLSQLASCERQFPVFVLGCEARTDDQRTIILDLIARTESRDSSRSFNHVKLLVQAVWAQDDLANWGLKYWDKLSSIISCCTIVPSLV